MTDQSHADDPEAVTPEAAEGPKSTESADPARKGLEALEEDIREVREKADDLIVGPDENEGERFYESGDDYKGDRNRDDPDNEEDSDNQDDQTITPPG